MEVTTTMEVTPTEVTTTTEVSFNYESRLPRLMAYRSRLL